MKSIRSTCQKFAVVVAMAGFQAGLLNQALAASTTTVSVGDDFFSPASVTINVGDTVKWTWAGGGLITHNSTGPGTPPLWASPSTSVVGTTFSHTFPTAGTYSYVCTFHAVFGMVGSVTVQPSLVNVPPSVAITAPTNGATFSAPWTGTIRAAASDPDDTVSQVEFFAGTTPLGTVMNPASSLGLSVTNLAAGNYSLTAVATDSRGGSSTSAAVTIHVEAPVPITLSAMHRLSATSAQFTFTTTSGLSYVVERSSNLAAFTPLRTNTASGSTMTFTDNNAAGPANFYRVRLLPNP